MLGHTVFANSSVTWIAHGIGVYFIAKGFFIAVSTHLETDMRDDLTHICALLEHLAERKGPSDDTGEWPRG